LGSAVTAHDRRYVDSGSLVDGRVITIENSRLFLYAPGGDANAFFRLPVAKRSLYIAHADTRARVDVPVFFTNICAQLIMSIRIFFKSFKIFSVY
jgi:hypothetical protein